MTDNYALHAILINKSVPFEQAQELADKIAKKKVKQYRETKNTYRFKYLPKTKFVKGTFRTKKVNKYLSLIYSELKPEFQHLQGSGLIDTIKDVGSRIINAPKNIYDTITKGRRLDDYNNTSKRTIEQQGNKRVVGLTIAREPLQNWINTAFNVVSFGRWSKGLEKEGIAGLFHLSLIVTLEDNTKVVVEKLDDVNVNTNFKFGDKTQYKNVDLKGKQFTLGQMLEETRKNVGDKTFFEYRSFDNNCFYFVSYLLKSVGLYGPAEQKFVFTDIKKFVDGLPSHTEVVANKITDIGALWSRISGRGRKKII